MLVTMKTGKTEYFNSYIGAFTWADNVPILILLKL